MLIYYFKLWKWQIVTVIAVICILFFYLFFYRAPTNFPRGTTLTVTNGRTITEIANDLHNQHFIRSAFLFKIFFSSLGREKGIAQGQYYFPQALSVYEMARRFAHSNYSDNAIKITIPEGANVFDIGTIISKKSNTFDKEKFISLAKQNEGYLFPDTYYFSPDLKPEDIIQMMHATFTKKVMTPNTQALISAFGRQFSDVITMASILEREARLSDTRRIVAGILWQRIDQGIPLQVDASFDYVNGKTTATLTLNDLKIDSPYNTYIHKGLPPTPIANPGIDSIIAAVTPIRTDYLYFLTDKEGNMRYAATLEQHRQNKLTYLGY